MQYQLKCYKPVINVLSFLTNIAVEEGDMVCFVLKYLLLQDWCYRRKIDLINQRLQ